MTTSAAIRKGARRAALPWLLFAFGLASIGLPLLGFRHVPSQDGASHYNTAMVLAGLHSDARPFLERYFELVPSPVSNQAASRLMAWTAEAGVAAAAERLVWAAILAGFAAVAVANLGRERVAFSLLLFPVFAGALVNLGFLNFLIGLVLFTQSAFLLQAGLRRASRAWLAGLIMLTAATFLAHPLAGMALGAVQAAFACCYVAQALIGRRRGSTEAPFAPLLPVGCLLSCVLLLSLAVQAALPQIVRFFSTTATNLSASIAPAPAAVPESLRERVIEVFGLGYFISYSPYDYLFSIGYGLLLAGLVLCRALAFWRTRAWRPEDCWLGPIVVLLALAMVVPRRFENFTPERLVGCLLVVVAIWLASLRLGRTAWRALLLAGLALNGGFLLWRLSWSASVDAILTEYASVAPYLPDGATVISLRSSPTPLQAYCRAFRPRQLPCRFKPTLHFMGEIVAARPIALLSNYQLRTDAGFFPIGLRAPWRDYLPLNQPFERWPPLPGETANIAAAEVLLARLPADVVVTWDERRATGSPVGVFPAEAAGMLEQYHEIFTSRPLGAARVYVRNAP